MECLIDETAGDHPFWVISISPGFSIRIEFDQVIMRVPVEGCEWYRPMGNTRGVHIVPKFVRFIELYLNGKLSGMLQLKEYSPNPIFSIHPGDASLSSFSPGITLSQSQSEALAEHLDQLMGQHGKLISCQEYYHLVEGTRYYPVNRTYEYRTLPIR